MLFYSSFFIDILVSVAHSCNLVIMLMNSKTGFSRYVDIAEESMHSMGNNAIDITQFFEKYKKKMFNLIDFKQNL